MAADSQKMVILITHGLDDERSSVAWSVANGAVATGFEVTVFLASAGVDWARKGAADTPHLNPLDPTMKDMVQKIRDSGGTIMVCPPCAKVRGYTENDLIEGAILAGSVAMHEVIKQGAATLSF
jgi:predicted peroxiredoxin